MYELIYNAPRVVESIERDYSDSEPVRFVGLDIEPEPDSDPLCDDTRVGRRICDGFALLGFEG